MFRLFPLLILLTACAFDASGVPAADVPQADAADMAPPPDARVAADAPQAPLPPPAIPDAGARPDAGAGDIGWECDGANECKSGVCFDYGAALGKRCAKLCRGQDDQCPSDFQCQDGVCWPD